MTSQVVAAALLAGAFLLLAGCEVSSKESHGREAGSGSSEREAAKLQAGARCSAHAEGDGRCSADGKEMLACRGGEVRAVPCRGARGCSLTEGKIACDNAIARVGDPCAGDGRACSEGGKERLRCDKDVMVAEFPCRGPEGCVVSGPKIKCDRTVGVAGDPCEPKLPGACAPGGAAALECRGGKLVEVLKCKGPKKCTTSWLGVDCDWSVAAPGDPCDEEEAGGCSEDGTSILVCKSGKLVVTKKGCKCVIEDDGDISCR